MAATVTQFKRSTAKKQANYRTDKFQLLSDHKIENFKFMNFHTIYVLQTHISFHF